MLRKMAKQNGNSHRKAEISRQTKETQIRLALNLDGSGKSAARTGVGFFDHMLDLLARHSLIDMSVDAKGDLEVDAHHTVEDVGIVLGQAIEKALGDKRGIYRYGWAIVPMDETLASVALDLGGRPYLVFEGAFRRERVGDLPTELVPHFFRSLCDGAGMNLHLQVRGDNDHHQVEACFKAVARALRQAIRREGGGLPSTKGVL